MTLSCNFVKNKYGAQYKVSYPENSKGAESSYSLSASVSTSEVGISGDIEEKLPIFIIKNTSDMGTNKFNLVYDFQPGWHGKHIYFTSYLHSSNPHIAKVSVDAKSKNYGFCMRFSTNVAKTQGWFVLNSSSDCTRLTTERSIVTNFK